MDTSDTSFLSLLPLNNRRPIMPLDYMGTSNYLGKVMGVNIVRGVMFFC